MEISQLIAQLHDKTNDDAYLASDLLAKNGSEEVVNAMIELLQSTDTETKIMAARTLGLIKNNAVALDALLETIDNNPSIAGDLMVFLDGFDLSDKFVPIFKYSLYGSFKVVSIAEELLDYKEFDITPRVLKKATKAWNHYVNNVKHDEVFELKKEEVEGMLEDLRDYLENE